MPRKARELTALEVRRANHPGLHFAGGVPGLALQVLPTGSRSWILRTVMAGRRRDIGLGGFPETSLADARSKAASAREKIRQGIDPIAERRSRQSALRASLDSSITFKSAATRYVEAHAPSWSNRKHEAQWTATLKNYVYPLIGSLQVSEITVAHILRILEQPTKDKGRFWDTRTETASRVRGRVERILDWAKGRGYRHGDNPAAWKGNLEALLPRPSKLQKVKHFPAVALSSMASFMKELGLDKGVAARALEFAILTAARSGEVRGMTWGEIDLVSKVWTIPAERMKARKEHRVPLSTMAIALLNEVPQVAGSEYVFPGPRGKILSDMALLAVMRRLKREEVPHGFRSSFRDWVAEETEYPRDLAEMALAHAIGNAVEEAYRRGDMLERRREMMEDWSRFVYAPSS